MLNYQRVDVYDIWNIYTYLIPIITGNVVNPINKTYPIWPLAVKTTPNHDRFMALPHWAEDFPSLLRPGWKYPQSNMEVDKNIFPQKDTT